MMRLWEETLNGNEAANNFSVDLPYYEVVRDELISRAEMVSANPEIRDMISSMITVRVDDWRHQAQREGSHLSYTRLTGMHLPLLKNPTEDNRNLFTCLNSLRDVEPSVGLIFSDYGLDRVRSTAEEGSTETTEEQNDE
jgi:hypothetical protein